MNKKRFDSTEEAEQYAYENDSSATILEMQRLAKAKKDQYDALQVILDNFQVKDSQYTILWGILMEIATDMQLYRECIETIVRLQRIGGEF